VAQEGDRIAVLYQVQEMVWYSGVMLTKR